MKEELNEIFKSEGLRDVSLETIEAICDSKISNEVVKGIPILNAIDAIIKIYFGVSDRIFIKKALSVLYELKEVSQQDRVNLLKDLSDNFESGVEKIMMAIDKIDTMEKCKVFGRLCHLRAKGKINVDSFKRLTKLIQDAYIADLELIKDFKSLNEIEDTNGNYSPLISLNLIQQGKSKVGSKKGNTIRAGEEIVILYCKSKLGSLLLLHYNYLFPEWNVDTE